MFSYELWTAHHAQNILAAVHQTDQAKNLENLVTKTLGVLLEQGFWMAYLYLDSRKNVEKNLATTIQNELLALLKRIQVSQNDSTTLKDYLKITLLDKNTDLDTLFLATDLCYQMLTYVRYGAKATGSDENTMPGEAN